MDRNPWPTLDQDQVKLYHEVLMELNQKINEKLNYEKVQPKAEMNIKIRPASLKRIDNPKYCPY